jgi:uncharacterized protein
MKQSTGGYRGIIALLAVIVVLQWVIMFTGKQQPARKVKPAAKRPVAAKKTVKAFVPAPPPAPAVTVPAVVPPVAPVVSGSKGYIAIVLDDWGYNLNNMQELEQIQAPITLAVLPNLPYSEIVAARAHASGKEVILHLPMEPYERLHWERNTVLTTMDPAQIRAILSADLDDLKFAKGVSNHQGSKATGDDKVMTVLMKELRRRRLYFLDSYVTSKSVAAAKASLERVPSIPRDVFLDNQSDPQYIRGQVNKLKKKAALSGRAVGIGHDRVNTLLVLKEMVPEMIAEGYEILPVSALIARPKAGEGRKQ